MVARLNRAGAHDPAKVTFDQRDPRTLHSHIRSRAHGDADLGLRQRWSIVDPITGHGDEASLLLKPLDLVALVLWQDLGDDVIDARACAPLPPPSCGCLP